MVPLNSAGVLIGPRGTEKRSGKFPLPPPCRSPCFLGTCHLMLRAIIESVPHDSPFQDKNSKLGLWQRPQSTHFRKKKKHRGRKLKRYKKVEAIHINYYSGWIMYHRKKTEDYMQSSVLCQFSPS